MTQPTKPMTPAQQAQTAQRMRRQQLAMNRHLATYNTQSPNSPPPAPVNPPSWYQRTRGVALQLTGENPQVNPGGFPRFLANRRLIVVIWLAAMAAVCVDEWRTYHLLPRPARLWTTTLGYAILGLASAVDVIVPIANLIALGLLLVLLYQLFQSWGAGEGQSINGPTKPPAQVPEGRANG
jgi:hypothetical protein